MKVPKAFKRLIALPCALAIALSLLAPTVAFAEETAAVTAPDTVFLGEDFTVQVSFSADENIGSIKATLDYDSDIIEFVSGDFAVGGGGVCIINAWSEISSPQQNYKLTFHAVSEGSSQIVITRCLVYSETGDLLGAPTYIGSVTVDEAAATTTTTTATAEQTTTSETTTAAPTQTTTTTTTTTTAEITTTTQATAAPETSAEQPQSSEEQTQQEIITEQQTTAPENIPQTESSFPEKEKTDERDDKGAITAILITIGLVVIVGVVMSSGGSGKKRRRKR